MGWMVWIDRASVLFQFLGFVGMLLGLYVFLKIRAPLAVVAGLICAIGFVLPWYWLSILSTRLPALLKNGLIPYTVPGIIVSFFLNVAPLLYLVPLAVPGVLGGRKKRA